MKVFRYGIVAAAILTYMYISTFLFFGKHAQIVSREDKKALDLLQRDFQKCVRKNGRGLHSEAKDYCNVHFFFSNGTKAEWRDPKTGKLEPLHYELDLCETLSIWEQVRNSSTILTKEYIDGLPNGWRDYAWRRINKGITLNQCQDKNLCEAKLSEVLPKVPPYFPRQFGRCAVVGNSGDLLKTKFGREIDGYDAVLRSNGAPTENYTEYVGTKRTFRLLNRGSAKALDKVAAMDGTGKEVLIIKTTVHDTMTRMIKDIPIPNPVYLMLGTSLGSSAKGTGVKGLEFALSVCETVDIYGFTVDPGYTEWSRYFSESRGGHTPLLGRAYYQMMECLGLIRIHSPLRMGDASAIPLTGIIESARRASERIRRKAAKGSGDPLSSCVMWRKREEKISTLHLGISAKAHNEYVGGVTQYPLEHTSTNGMLCVR